MRRIRTGLGILSATPIFLGGPFGRDHGRSRECSSLLGRVRQRRQLPTFEGHPEGVKGVCDQEGKTITITATDDAAGLKGIEALAAAGYHGKLETKAVYFPRERRGDQGKGLEPK